METFRGILGSETTRQLQEFEPGSRHKSEIGRDDLIELGLFSAQQWERKFAELISVFDLAGLREAMGAFAELEADQCSEIEHAMKDQVNPDRAILEAYDLALSRAFLTLYDRGALNRLLVVEEVPDSVQKQLDRMVKEVESAESVSVVQPATPVVTEDPVEVCVRDWHEMGSDAFKKKYISDTRNRPYYEAAIAAGKI
jgi:hypothetical protein